MANLDAVREELQRLKESLAIGEISPEQYDALYKLATADLTAEEHIELGVLSAAPPQPAAAPRPATPTATAPPPAATPVEPVEPPPQAAAPPTEAAPAAASPQPTAEPAAPAAAAPPPSQAPPQPAAAASPPPDAPPTSAPAATEPDTEAGFPAFPDLDEEVFLEEMDAPGEAVEGAAPAAVVEGVPLEEIPGRQIPWIPVAIGAAALVVVVVVLVLVMRTPTPDMSDDPVAAVNQVLVEAQGFFDDGNQAKAIRYLEASLMQLPAGDPGRSRIERRIADYQQALAGPTPTPIPDNLAPAQQALDQGLLLGAYGLVMEGLRSSPRDQGLLDLKQQINETESLVESLFNALVEEDYRTSAFVADNLVKRYPGQPEYDRELRRGLFNAAVTELRALDLKSAEEHFTRFDELEPGDPEVARVREIISRYRKRKPDAQLEIFANNLVLR